MNQFRKSICLLLTMCMLASFTVIPAYASPSHSEDPQAVKDYNEFGAAPDQETQPVTQPTEAEEETAASEETVPEESTPAPTEPEAQEPEEPAEPEEPQSPAQVAPAETASEASNTLSSDSDEPKGHNGIPLYFQNDYPNNMYGIGTIANNGCSAACLAMVATYMTGHEYLPDEIARYFGGAAENNIARLETGSETMQLAWKKSENFHETMAALREGKIAIALMDGASLFTDSQHFIVLTGLNEDGRIMVNDSNRKNYDKWDIKKALRNGFEEGDLLKGYSGAWIYDKEAMPEKPFLYSEPLPVRGEPRYGVELTWEEIQLLAKVVWVEARGECNEGQQAVAEVALNRLVSGNFPNNLHDVIYGENQFRSAKFLEDAEPYQLQYEMIENALYGPYILPMDVVYFATTAKTEKVWGQIGGHIFCYGEPEPAAETVPAEKETEIQNPEDPA